MELIKETTIKLLTTDGQEIKEGNKVVYSLNDGTCHCGIYAGMNARNNLLFDSVIESGKTVSVMPKSIKGIFKANIDVVEMEKLNAD